MDLLFTDPAGEAIIKNTDFTDFYPSVNVSTKWKYLKPYLRAATTQYILPYIGTALYDDIIAASSGILLEVREELKFALSNYGIFLGTPSMNVAISEAGLFHNNPESASPLSLWAFNSLRWNAIYNGDRHLDSALKLIVDNIADTVFDDYKISKYYAKTATILFSGVDQMGEYNQVDSFRSYVAMIPYIRKAEDILTEKVCTAQVTALLAEGSPTAIQTRFLHKARAYVAEMTVYLALPHLNIYHDNTGIVVISSIDGLDSRFGVFSKNNVEAINLLSDRVRQDADKYLSQVMQMLYADPDEFPVWKDASYVENSKKSIIHTTDCMGGAFL